MGVSGPAWLVLGVGEALHQLGSRRSALCDRSLVKKKTVGDCYVAYCVTHLLRTADCVRFDAMLVAPSPACPGLHSSFEMLLVAAATCLRTVMRECHSFLNFGKKEKIALLGAH